MDILHLLISIRKGHFSSYKDLPLEIICLSAFFGLLRSSEFTVSSASSFPMAEKFQFHPDNGALSRSINSHHGLLLNTEGYGTEGSSNEQEIRKQPNQETVNTPDLGSLSSPLMDTERNLALLLGLHASYLAMSTPLSAMEIECARRAKTNTHCPQKRVPSADHCFFTLRTHHAATQELQRRRTMQLSVSLQASQQAPRQTTGVAGARLVKNQALGKLLKLSSSGSDCRISYPISINLQMKSEFIYRSSDRLARRGRCVSVARLPTMANGTTENTSCLVKQVHGQ
ncbi:UNVERIFIED_CONTAM: hypothetical protein FKN15_004678 [Acipenser sinensis]